MATSLTPEIRFASVSKKSIIAGMEGGLQKSLKLSDTPKEPNKEILYKKHSQFSFQNANVLSTATEGKKQNSGHFTVTRIRNFRML